MTVELAAEKNAWSFTCRTTLDPAQNVVVASTAGVPALRIGGLPGVGGWNPHELFVAAIQGCLILTFADLANRCGLRIAECESEATGEIEQQGPAFRFASVTIYPAIRVHDEPSVVSARAILQQAKQTCRVANSLRCEILVYPTITTTSHPR